MVYQHSIWQNKKPVRQIKDYVSDDLSYNEDLKKRQMKYIIRKKQAEKAKFFIVLLTIFGLLIPFIFMNNLNTLFLKKFRNSYVMIPNDISFLSTTEAQLADNIFLGTRYVDYINSEDPEMDSPTLVEEMPNLTRQLKNLVVSYSSLKPGIFIWDYSTGKYVNINADKIFPAASIIKIPILFQLYRRAEKGLVDLDSSMSTSEPFLAAGSGTLQYAPPGTTLTYRNLAELMMQNSDNTASNMLLASVGGMSELNRAIKQWGFGVTHLSNWLPDLDGTNETTPAEMGKLLYNVDNSDFLSIKSRSEIVEIMGHIKNRFLLQEPLPNNVQFLHKTGDIGTMLGDAGVVILPDGRKYIIVVMVDRPWNDYSAKQLMIETSDAAYKAISQGRF